jgi:spore protease
MKNARSDLAIEICENLSENKSPLPGIECTEYTSGLLSAQRVRITTPEGEKAVGKPMGTYLTADCGRIWMDDGEVRKKKLLSFREMLCSMLPNLTDKNPSVLVACLGNEAITADAVGPVTAKHLLVTRHLKKEKPRLFHDLSLFDLCAVCPGVLGQTGIESADVIQSITKATRPSLVLVVDALASRSLSRLVSTIQISDSGICPGSGVGNQRPEISLRTLGVPVLSIGVPTVVDAATLAADAIDAFATEHVESETIRKKWSENGLNFFVTPKETDQIVGVMGAFIAHGINLAFHHTLSYEDMQALFGG